MIFKFLKQKIILDVFTNRPEVLEHFRLERTNKFIPKWYKKAPIKFDNRFYPSSTIRGCYAIKEFFNRGFVLPLWSDLAINIKKDEKLVEYQFADNISSIHFHRVEQWKYYVDPKINLHFKIISPWKIKEKKGVHFSVTEFHWDKLFYDHKIVTGVLDFKQNRVTHINGFFSLKNDSTFILPANKPLVHYMPLFEEEIVLKHHLISDEEFNKLGSGPASFFLNGINKLKKCPF